jgi:hypothetical protein
MASPYADLSYFIGQGKVQAAYRNGNGQLAGGYFFLGDVAALTFDFAKQKMVTIEENISGYGGTAEFVSVAIPLSFSLSAQQWPAANLALALYGTASGANAGGNVTSEDLTLFAGGGINYLQNILASSAAITAVAGQVKSVAVTQGAGYATAPSVAFSAAPSGGVTATGHAVFNSSSSIDIVIDNPGEGYGTTAPDVTLSGGGSSTAATATASLTTASALVEGTDYSVGSGQFGDITTLIGSSSIFAQMSPGAPFQTTAAYAYASTNGSISMLTQAQPELALMFQGLNVANTNNGVFQPWRIYMKRAKLQLTKNLDLIGRKETTLDLQGELLFDPNPLSGSNYLDIIKG